MLHDFFFEFFFLSTEIVDFIAAKKIYDDVYGLILVNL